MPGRPRRTLSRLTSGLRLDGGRRGSLRSQPLFDYYVILACTVLLAGLGVLMGLSSSSVYAQSLGRTPFYFAIRQLVFLAVGTIAAVIVARMAPRTLRALGGLAYGGAVLLLVLVFTPLGGDAGKGNRAWLNLGPLGGVQPSEFAKFALVLIGSSYLAARGPRIGRIRDVSGYVALYAVVGLLVIAQGDMGTAMIIGLMMLAQMWAFGVPKRYVLGLVGLAVLGAAGLVVTTPYRLQRVMAFLGGGQDDAVSQQPLSAIYALASGGWWGVGIGASRQKWGGLYDGAQNDYVFAVLGEEMGLVGTLSVIALFTLLAWAGTRVALRSESAFLRTAAATVTAWTTVQALVNMAVALHLLPVVGVPLPFISIGGSALISNLAAIGVLLACARHEPDAAEHLAVARGSTPPRVTTVVDGGRRD